MIRSRGFDMRLKRPLLALSFGVAVALPVVMPAFGQSSGYPAACEASKVSKSDVERAHTVFLSGKGFLDESNYDKAISYFKDAYSIDCSVHAILPIIATAYERKGDKASAVQALQEYLKRVPAASDREVVERRIRNLQDQLGSAAASSAPPVASSAPPPASASASVAPAPLPSSTGSAGPTPTAPPSAPPPSNDAPSGHGVAPWIVVGVGGAALATGAVLYGVGAGNVSSASNACPARTACAPSVADQGNNGRSLETVGVIVGAVGVAGVAGGLLWHFLEPAGAGNGAASSGALSPVVAPGYAGVAASGRF